MDDSVLHVVRRWTGSARVQLLHFQQPVGSEYGKLSVPPGTEYLIVDFNILFAFHRTGKRY